MHMTNEPWLDAARHEDEQDAIAAALEDRDARQRELLEIEVRDAILSGNPLAQVTHVSIGGKRITAMLSEVFFDHTWDKDEALMQLLSAAARGDVAGAAAAAETIIATVAQRHAEDVCDRLDLSGEVMA